MKKVLPFIIVILLIIGVSGGIAWNMIASKYKPTEEFMDYAAEIGLEDGEYAITLNHTLLDSERAVEIDGRVYLSMELVTGTINTRFYWDENEQVFLYTTPTELITIRPDEQSYTVATMEDSKEADEGYVIVCSKNDRYYVAADYVKQHTQMNYAEYTEPNRVVIETQWTEIQTVSAKEDTAVRYKGGIKSKVLRNVDKNEQMVLLEAYDDWSNIVTSDGYVGWVENKYLTDAKSETPEAPAFDEPEYTSIQKDYKINLAWHQVMTAEANSSLSSVLSSTTGINTISPTWFYFSNTDGEVKSIATSDYVTTCHANGIEVWALFSNEFPGGDSRSFNSEKTDEVLGYTSKRASVISQLMSYVQQYDIDGINIDFESITQDGADDYIQFIRELSIACRYYGVVLSVDNYVPKYTYYYNRKEQGIVADYVVIMGYDENTGGSSTPGPVASLGFVREGITDTLAVVDKDKVINGIPLYSRVWSTDSDGNVSSFACGMSEALGYLTNHGVTPEFQEDIGLNYGSYTSDIDGNLYEIWLQDATAVEEEMKLIQEYDLAGVASWKIGFESGSDIWSLIRSYLE
jgi:spore germination protein YaaH